MKYGTLFIPMLFWVVGCGGNDSAPNGGTGELDAGVDTGGAGGQAGTGGTAGSGGISGAAGSAGAAGAEKKESRGEPSEFPEECLASCQEACIQLETCEGEESSFPLDINECIERCALAQTSPYGIWDDRTEHFRCCTSQDACFDVATCGGWLKHPSPGPSCEKLCDCMGEYMTIPPPPNELAPPEGYRFADNVVVFQGPSTTTNLDRIGADQLWSGSYTAIRFGLPVDEAHLRSITGGRQRLPTFYDSKGRIAAAVGDIFVEASPSQLDGVKAKAKTAGLATPEKVTFARNLYRIRSTDPWASLRALPLLHTVKGVRAELDMLRQYQKNFVPNDPRFPDQWHLLNTGQKEAVPGVDSRVTEAWDVTTGSPDVIIAINDDGVDINHPDLAAKCTEPLNFPQDWEQKLGDPISGFASHGTSVAGVAAAIGDNGEGVAGVCLGCRIMPHMVGEALGPTLQMTDQDIANGFTLMVDEGAWVINNSWGAGRGDPNFVTSSFPMPNTPAIVRAAFEYAETDGRDGKGTVILFAAGNDNEPVAVYAKEPTVVTVASVDDQGLKAYYSSHGAQVHISAPSNGGINGIVTTAVKGSYTDSFGGTSSASPFVAGVAGLILSANPDLSAQEVRDILAQSATKIDPIWGQYDNDGHSPFYGYGMVNAYVAVRLATGDCFDPSTCPAPSDDCGTECSKPACGICRTTADCAEGHVCQALPPLGYSLCVEEEVGACPSGTDSHNGYCIPDRATCDLCKDEETCNGRDDDCNGEVDDGLDCAGVRVLQCPVLGQGCHTDKACAATVCVDSCQEDGDCGEDRSCKQVKDRYGAPVPGTKGCTTDLIGTCKIGCDILASSMTDPEIEDFVTCMKDGDTPCFSAFNCASKLPINM